MRVGVVQMTSTDDLGANLAAARELVAQAADQGAELVALPENFAYLRCEGEPSPCAQSLDGEIVGTLRKLATRHRLWLVGGSFPEAIAGERRVHNTCTVLDPSGALVAIYRKIHLFDVDLAERGGGAYRESAAVVAGSEPVIAKTPFGAVGLSVCYDLRFPELYRALVEAGARWLVVPSAFTRETGRDHWEVLLRARAIENQAFVLAPAQVGQHVPGRVSYGRSMIVDPWGLVLARAPDVPAAVVAECQLQDQERIRAALPCLRHRRLGSPPPQAMPHLRR